MARKAKKSKLRKRYGRANAPPTRSPLQIIADDTTDVVLSETTRAAIEKIAEDFARDMHADPEYRAEVRREAIAAARRVAGELHRGRREKETGR